MSPSQREIPDALPMSMGGIVKHLGKLLLLLRFSAPLYMIMEYVPNGTLHDFIFQKRSAWIEAKQSGGAPKETLSAERILTFAFQVANGMEYLSSKHVSVGFKEALGWGAQV